MSEQQSDSRMSINGLLSPTTSATTINPTPPATPSSTDRAEYEPSAAVNQDMTLDGHDADALAAAQALGDMRRALPVPIEPSPTPSVSTSQPGIITRVSNYPLVGAVLGIYEHSKANNRIVNYAGGVVENSVKAVAAPVYDRLGGEKLDRLVNGVLDTVERRIASGTPGTPGTPSSEPSLSSLEVGINGGITASKPVVSTSASPIVTPVMCAPCKDASSISPPTSQLSHRNRTRSTSRSSSPHRHTLSSPTSASFHPYPTTHASYNTSLQTFAPMSRWQHFMLEATTTAGSTAAVVSEESMKCLRYCLNWLQYAVQHIDQQILILRDFLLALGFNPMSSSAPSNSQQLTVPSTASQTLSQIKKEVIDTLRKVVEVVSRYAGATLPDHARKSVRTFILSLPGRWASLNEPRTVPTPSPVSSPLLSPSPATPVTSSFSRDPAGQPTVAHMYESGVKVLNLAVESVEMLKGVSTIFSDTIERAEIWIDRLRVVGFGVTTPAANDMKSFDDSVPSVVLPPIRQPTSNKHTSKNRSVRMHARSKSPSPKYRSSSSSDNEMESGSEEESKRMPMLKKSSSRKPGADKKKKSSARKRVVPEDSGVDGDGMGMEGLEF